MMHLLIYRTRTPTEKKWFALIDRENRDLEVWAGEIWRYCPGRVGSVPWGGVSRPEKKVAS